MTLQQSVAVHTQALVSAASSYKLHTSSNVKSILLFVQLTSCVYLQEAIFFSQTLVGGHCKLNTCNKKAISFVLLDKLIYGREK